MLYKQNALKAQGKEYASQIKELEQQKKELSQEEKELEEFKEYVKTDEYVEEVARDKFGLVYKGEIIFEPEEEK
jgi:cell division protein FtsB